jgi:hypothetical protein
VAGVRWGRPHSPAAPTGPSGAELSRSGAGGLAAAVLCFAACAAVVVYGIYLIVSRFR